MCSMSITPCLICRQVKPSMFSGIASCSSQPLTITMSPTESVRATTPEAAMTISKVTPIAITSACAPFSTASELSVFTAASS